MHTRLIAVTCLAASVALLVQHRAAHACGGCFSPPETVTSVDSHRMVIALGLEKTILWDQIRYSGDPQDFVWVLPVPSVDATIDVSEASFFDELETQTAPYILPPPLPPPPSCPPPPSDDSWPTQDAGASAVADAGVDVYREEVVGPYQTVLIGAEDPGALLQWLNGNGYLVPDSTRPIIQHYIDLRSKFIVLRLAPDQGVSAMQPVRVEYPGYMATFPLKMVTVGAWGSLDITLWVIAEQRYEARNYGTVVLPPDQIVWDFSRGRSNYSDLFRATIDGHGGKAFIAQYAAPMSRLWFSDDVEPDRVKQIIPFPYVTRLRTDQLVDHLSEDLVLAPSDDASGISEVIQAQTGINYPPPRTCPDWNGDGRPDTWDDYNRSRGGVRSSIGCGLGGGSAGGGAAALLILGLIALTRRGRRSV